MEGDDLGMIQEHYICCALYFYYYYISSPSDDQALDPRGWGSWPWRIWYLPLAPSTLASPSTNSHKISKFAQNTLTL